MKVSCTSTQKRFTCISQPTFAIVPDQNETSCGERSILKNMDTRRSGCPVSISLEIFGDRWSLLIIRDLMVRGYRTFKDFKNSGEGIATNILADRLRRLEAEGIICAEASQSDQRSGSYRLTKKGIDLAPVLLELLIWGARHESTSAPCGVIEHFEQHREQVLAEVRRRWQERDDTPFLPPFPAVPAKQTSTRTRAVTNSRSSTSKRMASQQRSVRRRG